jgi:hypothetical protein
MAIFSDQLAIKKDLSFGYNKFNAITKSISTDISMFILPSRYFVTRILVCVFTVAKLT